MTIQFVISRVRLVARYFYRWLTLPQRVAEMHDRLISMERSMRSTYVGDHLALVRTQRGYRLYVDTRDRGVGNDILLDGFYEEAITKALRTLWKPGMQVLEIGANIGYYTVQAADLVGTSGKVWAFEANPEVARLLQLNLYTNGFVERVEVVPKAASNRTGEDVFNIYDERLGSSSLGLVDTKALGLSEEQSQPRHIKVPLVAADDVVPPEAMIAVAKIDAEGSEPFVIRGMRRIIENNRDLVIIMEFMPANLLSTGNDPQLFLQELMQMEFEIAHITGKGTILPISFEDILLNSTTELVLKRKS